MPMWEWIAAALGVVNVALVVRRSVWNYPFGIAMVALYFFVFLDSKLYSDALLQIFFLIIQLYGWWAWIRAPQHDHGVAVERVSGPSRLAWLCGTIAASLIWGAGMARYTDAAAPFVDAAVAGASVSAQWLQSLRRYEAWVLWIVADLIAVPLYWWKGLLPTAGLYLLFLIMAVVGMFEWRKRLAR